MRRFSLPVLILAAGLAPAAHAQTPAHSVAPTAEDGLMVGAIDDMVPACQDFYAHACNGWLAANPIPSEEVDNLKNAHATNNPTPPPPDIVCRTAPALRPTG